MGIFSSLLKTIRKTINGGKDLFEPVEGISLETWAKANARIASGINTEEAVKELGMDMPKWDRVNTEWLTRLKTERTYSLSIRYAKIFNENAYGNLPGKKELSEDTFTIEKYAEVTAAMDFLCKHGRDAQDVLKDFGLTVTDYSNLGSYWGKKILMSPLGVGIRFQNSLMEFRAKYEKSAEQQNRDIQF